MTIQTPADGRETVSFKIADRKIDNLLKRLRDKNVCRCCTARALVIHGVCLAEETLGSAEAIEMYEELIANLRKNNTPAPDYGPSSAEH